MLKQKSIYMQTNETEPIPHTIHKNKFHLAGNQIQSNNHMNYFRVKKKCIDYIFLVGYILRTNILLLVAIWYCYTEIIYVLV